MAGEIGEVDLKNLCAPEPISSAHNLTGFSCGHESLDNWLTQRALKNEANNSTRTFVVCNGDNVVGYYSLAAGSVMRDHATSKLQRNSPDPIPVIILCRLAVQSGLQGRGIGRSLVRDALLRSIRAAEDIGVRAILVHALDGKVVKFYLDLGFEPSPIQEETFFMPLMQVKKILEGG